jgi:mannose-6-phosphate isomerase-like protein (cupin superfamily)
MKGFVTNLETETLGSQVFRRVLYTTKQSQLVLMSLQPGEDIGSEVHADHDQFIRIESGEGEVVLNGEYHNIKDGSAVVIPAGTTHNLRNTSVAEVMHLYTLYCPPEHKDKTIHVTKADALAGEEHFDGVTSE